MTKIFKLILLFIGILFFPLIGYAQLTLDECQQFAQENYPLLKKYDLIKQTSNFTLENIGFENFPQVKLNALATYQSDAATLPGSFIGTGENDEVGVNKFQYRIGFDVDQTLWDGNRVKYKKKDAQHNEAIQIAQTDVEMYELRNRINNLFFGILLLEEKIKLNKEYQDRLSANCTKLENLNKKGLITKSDVNITRAELLKAKQQQISLQSSKDNFSQILSIFIGKPIEEIANLKRPDDQIPLNSSVNRPELRLFDAQINKTTSQIDLINAGIKPKVSLFSQGHWGYPGYDMFHDVYNHTPTFNIMVGVRVSWNIGNLYTLKNDLRKVDITRADIENSREIFLFNNNLKSTEDKNKIDYYNKIIDEDKEIINLLTSIRQTSENKLNNGIVDAYNLILEFSRENEARINMSIHEIERLKYIYELKHTINQ